jgi:hypothetical protein
MTTSVAQPRCDGRDVRYTLDASMVNGAPVVTIKGPL